MNYLPVLILAVFLSIELGISSAKIDRTGFIIRKPYQEEWEPIPEQQEELDIDLGDLKTSNRSCPLPQLIGCYCASDENEVNCVYSNELNRLPEFSTQVQSSEDEEFSLNLKCKNVSHITDFKGLMPLASIKRLDLSGFQNRSEYEKHCKWSGSSINSILNLSQLGKNVYVAPEETNETQTFQVEYLNLTIDSLILDHNKLIKIYMNKLNLFHYAGGQEKNLDKRLKYLFRIKYISLKYNRMEDLNNFKYNLDICFLNLNELDVSHNKLALFDAAYLVYLDRVNMSHNMLKTFSAYFFDETLTTDCNQIKYVEMTEDGKNKTIFISNLKSLDMSYNHLASVPFSHYKNINFSNLEFLNLNHNKLTVLQANDFHTMSILKHLSLDHNRFINIDSMTFVGLSNLKHLDLNSNHKTEIKLPAKLFKEIANSVEHISLQGNHLNQIPIETLRFGFKVKQIFLNENKIKQLLDHSFGHMYNLLEIYLSNNLIEHIETHAFGIAEESVAGPGLVEKLDLSYNQLTSLQANMFSYMTNLRYILLNNNLIKTIDTNAFHGINYLISLDLSLNKIEKLNFLSNRNLSNLRYLRLSNNNISRLRAAQFICLKSMKTLDLSSNRIRRITDCAFHGLQKTIKKLQLNYNQIYSLNSCAFRLDFTSLRFVQIGQNPLKCTNNCEFYVAVYVHPHSIDYLGLECESGAEVFRHTSNFSHCSQQQYKRIHESCNNMNKFCSKNMSHFEADCEYKVNEEDFYDTEDEHLDMLDPFRMRRIENEAKKTFDYLNVLLQLFLINFINFISSILY